MTDCPCNSGSAYDACCGPVHRGESSAATAEALMRSRYCAFVQAEIDYLRTSTHPEMREDWDEESVRQWATTADWQGFEVVRTEAGGPEDATGVVEFIARYAVQGSVQEHHEVSEFRRADGTWFFYDGKEVPVTVRREEPKVGRNDPCPCGSGKKFKKCCGRA